MIRKILFAAAVFIFVFIASSVSSTMATGTDNQAVDTISEVTDNGYKPWFEPYWTPDSTGESILFALQAALGALVIGHFLIPDKCNVK